ncbi:type VI-B CRISPR-associated RNA-guided ribonuclease Cas13b [Ancylomarina longa]|uniref:Uncharacterized protein n=1 Tax=Ancylomarina longa TaxID=2487017 RepID=A0A434AXR7_9BACT|nr:type VI-B CRISPR-associated RNA-guided ribonuclease Cas13b [Ancylomarina longa]RUT79210.1 hypothetical protein DLK05_05180 [Ancylomarina longa]
MEEKYYGQGVSYTLNHKHYFALYLNLAQNNLNKILGEFEKIYPRLHHDYLPNQPGALVQKLHQLLPLTEEDAVETRGRLNYLSRSLPFVNAILKQGEYTAYREELIHFFTRMNQLRNYFTHDLYQIDELEFGRNEKLFRFLNEIKKLVLYRLNKEPYFIGSENLTHLAEPNGYFNFLAEQNKKAAINFLVCLFLERKTAMEFLKVQRGYKSSNNPAHKATLSSFTHFSVKMPKPVLESKDFEFRFVLDGINELKRCPKDLFHHFPDQNKELCQTTAEVQMEKEETGEMEMESRKVDLIRYEDKFPYFALRYLDEMNLLPKIRFQVCIGHRKEKFHTHDNATEPVVHHKRVYAFTSLHKLLQENPYTEQFLNEDGIKEHHLKPGSGLENFAPTYAIHDQNIKFVIQAEKFDKFPDLCEENPKAILADGIISIYELKNLVYACLLGRGERAKAENKLLNQVKNYNKFLSDLQCGVFPNINYMAEKNVRKEEFNSYLAKNYQMQNTHIPKQIRRSLLQIKQASYQEKALKKWELWHNDNEEKFYRLKNYLDLAGTEDQPKLKKGSLANELTRDIQFFLPEKYKLELFEYSNLQKALAFYQEGEVERLLRRELQLSYFEKTDKENNKYDLFFEKKHPFLHKVFQVESFNPRARFPKPKVIKNDNSSLFHFAQNYYKQKRKWLENVNRFLHKTDTSSLKEAQGLLYYFKLGTSEENGKRIYHREYGSRYLKPLIADIKAHNIPVNMPSGLFRDILARAGVSDQNNASRQIECDFPATQAFYQFQRQHPIHKQEVDLEQIHSEYRHLHKMEYRNEKENKSHKTLYYFLKREQKIRYYQTCDRLLWKMIQEYLQLRCKDMNLDFSEIDLCDIYTPSVDGQEMVNALEEKKVEISFPIGDRKFCIQEKLKNFGRIARYRYDSRFVSLFRYKGEDLYAGRPEEEVHAKIAGALHDFTREQLELFEAVHVFEQFIHETCADKLESWQNEIREKNQQADRSKQMALHYFSHCFLMQKALAMGIIPDADKMELLIQARNSAAHNKVNEQYIRLSTEACRDNYFGEAIQLYKQIIHCHDIITN